MQTGLPIDSVMSELKQQLNIHNRVVLGAAPGAGKTTRVPPALLGESWLFDRKIIMLEPRRLAARATARFMAAAFDEKVGETVGYRVRGDSRVGRNTRIEVVTEGLLTRMLQDDPALEQVGLVIFDEFHERNVQADLGLALVLQSQELLRDDLKLLIMSATIDTDSVAAWLEAPAIVCHGRSFPVETIYAQHPGPDPSGLERRIVDTVQHAINKHEEGDVLVFLPGAKEIRRTEMELNERMKLEVSQGKIVIAPLYGMLPPHRQDEAIAPVQPGQRKVVLSTPIAETSLTVEGVRIVIDSGLVRVPRFSPRTGMTRLETEPVSRASADQRRGRAGRLAPGVCYRLWTREGQRRLAPYTPPEMTEADLAPLALELAAWGTRDPGELRWLDPPPHGAFAQARELLQQLGALDESGGLSTHGRRMHRLGIHPRLAHMLLSAAPETRFLACELAALLSERDLLAGQGSASDPDLRERLQALREHGDGGARAGAGAVQRMRQEAQRLAHMLSAVTPSDSNAGGRHASGDHAIGDERERAAATGSFVSRSDAQSYDVAASPIPSKSSAHVERTPGRRILSNPYDPCGRLLAFAFPDRIAQNRGDGRFLLANGRGAVVQAGHPFAREPYLVAVELDDIHADSRIRLAVPLQLAELETAFADSIERIETFNWDASRRTLRSYEQDRYGAIVLRETMLTTPDPESVGAAWVDVIRREGLRLVPWTHNVKQFRERCRFMKTLVATWPDFSDEALIDTLDDWLGPYLYGRSGQDALRTLPIDQALRDMLTREQKQQLEEWAPTHIQVPSGSRIHIDYSDPERPVLSVRLQEMFGLTDTPRIGGGRVPLTLHLLSPAQRPVQVTQDLAGFWSDTYYEVRKELKGRYPKHAWPEDPRTASPTRRTRRNKL